MKIYKKHTWSVQRGFTSWVPGTKTHGYDEGYHFGHGFVARMYAQGGEYSHLDRTKIVVHIGHIMHSYLFKKRYSPIGMVRIAKKLAKEILQTK